MYKFKIGKSKWKRFGHDLSGGFTIIETLVAITILMIAVAGPLVVADKGLNSALYARDQTIASYLAQESMEMIKHIRDLNEDTGATSWLANLAQAGACTTLSSPCDASAISGGVTPEASGGIAITFNGNTGYVNSGGSTPTIFNRYFYLTAPNTAVPCSDSTMTECEARVVVIWNEGTVPYEVDMNSELVNNPSR